MPKLPTQDDLKSVAAPSVTPSVQVPKTDSIDYRPMAEGGKALASGLDSVGKAFGVVASAMDEVDDYETKKKIVDFNLQSDLAFEEAKRNVKPGAEGFQQAWEEDYTRRAKEFFGEGGANISPRYRQKVDLALVEQNKRLTERAQRTELDERDRFHADEVGTKLIDLQNGASQAPDTVTDRIREGQSLIQSSRLSPAVKDRLRKKFAEDAEEYAVRGRIERGDGESVIDDIRQRPRGSPDPLMRNQSRPTGEPYSGTLPRIDTLPDGQPFTPQSVPKTLNQSRPNFERGRMQLSVGDSDTPVEVPYFTGSKDKANYPGLQYGAFTLLPHRVGESHRYGDTISINPLGATRQEPIEDPKVGRIRTGQLIHPEQGNPTNIGCISVPDGDWSKVKGAVEEMWKQHGKTNVVLVNAPGMTQIMSRSQYDAMYGGGGNENDTGGKRFLALPGLGGTFGNDRKAFEDIGRKYGAKVDYLEGDPEFGGAKAGPDGKPMTSPQVAAAVKMLSEDTYDGIIGFSAGGYNVRQILESPQFQALPEEKRARIQKVIAVGLSDEHVGDFKLDPKYNPEVYGNGGGQHLDAPRAYAKQIGAPSGDAQGDEVAKRISPQEFFRDKGVDVSTLPLGMRISNNPGNIKFSGSAWQKENLYGLEGPSQAKDEGSPQAQFANPLAGMASAVKLAQTKFNAHGLDTVEKIIADPKQGWTPRNTSAAANIAAAMGVTPGQKIDLNDAETMGQFMRALITQEHGEAGNLYDDKLVTDGVALAMTGKSGGRLVQTADSDETAGVTFPESDTVKYPNLSPGRRLKLENVARVAMRAGTEQELKNITEKIRREGDNGAADGVLRLAAKVMLPNQIMKHKLAINEARMQYQALNPLPDMTEDEAWEHLQKLVPGAKGDEESYKSQARVFDAASKRWEKITEERRKDPVSATASAKSVLDVIDRVSNDKSMPEAQRRKYIIEARLAEQARLGIDELQQRVVSKDEARRLLAGIGERPADMDINSYKKALLKANDYAEKFYGPELAPRALADSIALIIHGKPHDDMASSMSNRFRADMQVKILRNEKVTREDIARLSALSMIDTMRGRFSFMPDEQDRRSFAPGGLGADVMRQAPMPQSAPPPAMPQSQAPPATQRSSPPPAAPRGPNAAEIKWLQDNPDQWRIFDSKFGAREAARYLQSSQP